MGTWSTGLFGNDIACDVKDTYMSSLRQGMSHDEAYEHTLAEYSELIGTDEEPLFWYAIAETQWNLGVDAQQSRLKAMEWIAQQGGISLWAGNAKYVARWEKVLVRLREKLEAPLPPLKRIRRELPFETNPWNCGDVYAYQFHTALAAECGLLGKYILFQKIGETIWFQAATYSVIQVFHGVFDSIPSMDAVRELHILPLTNLPECYGGTKAVRDLFPEYQEYNPPKTLRDYIPDFTTAYCGTMIYYKKIHFPKKHMFFIGNEQMENRLFSGGNFSEYFWERDKMEDWLISFYLQWKDIDMEEIYRIAPPEQQILP